MKFWTCNNHICRHLFIISIQRPSTSEQYSWVNIVEPAMLKWSWKWKNEVRVRGVLEKREGGVGDDS
jgi:hypothetical protein